MYAPLATLVTALGLGLLASVTPAAAQHTMQGTLEGGSGGAQIADPDLLRTVLSARTRAPQTLGERVVMDAEATLEEIVEAANRQRIFFEPAGLPDYIRSRPDLVLLMRHGPTDWSFLDRPNVDPEDCENQRIMTVQGREDMRALGHILANGAIIPSRVISSRWCRNQDTTRNFLAGLRAHPNAFDGETTLEWDNETNLLLSANGAENVTPIRERIAAWNARQDGETDEGPLPGPLLIITHFTNIAELTEFNVYEGEMLVIDPDRNNRVLGYLRLADAAPDIGHFDASVAVPAPDPSSAGDAVAATVDPVDVPALVTVEGRDGDEILLADTDGRILRVDRNDLDAFLKDD